MQNIRTLRNLIILALLILNVSCKSQFATNELNHNFTKEQISDLQKITDFFRTQICADENYEFKTCFEKFLPDLVNSNFGYKAIYDKVDFEKQKLMYKSISKNTFDQIWSFCHTTNYHLNTEYESLCGAGYTKQYVKFLIELGKSNKIIADYADKLIASGDFDSSSYFQQRIYDNKNDFDFSNPNIQLWIAIHFLTQNDQEKRNEY